jgi:hypothetical protein
LQGWFVLACCAVAVEALLLLLLVVAVFAPTGARLTMQDVTVLQLPSLCNQQQQQDSTTAAVVATEAQLLAALADGDIGTILITSDITLHSGTWQVRIACKQSGWSIMLNISVGLRQKG